MTSILGEGKNIRFGMCNLCHKTEVVKDYHFYSPLAPKYGGIDEERPLCKTCRGCYV